jgi:hypothetical protein
LPGRASISIEKVVFNPYEVEGMGGLFSIDRDALRAMTNYLYDIAPWGLNPLRTGGRKLHR